jgi:mitochondrial fission protein ELM1
LSNNISTTGNFVSGAGPNTPENTCWVLTEGKAGMENQALGLAERLNMSPVVKRVRLKWPWNKLAPYSPGAPFGRQTADSDSIAPPWPRLVIGVGRQSIPFMAAIKRASGGRTVTVQTQDPRVPLSSHSGQPQPHYPAKARGGTGEPRAAI